MRSAIIILVLILLLSFAGCANQPEMPQDHAADEAAGVIADVTDTPSPTPEPTPTATPEPTPTPTPIRSETAYAGTREPTRSQVSFITSKNGEEIIIDSAPDIPAYLDVISVNKEIDENDITFYLEVRDMPESLPINRSGLSGLVLEYCWYISFDVDGNGQVTHNATFNHDRFWEKDKEPSQAAVDSDAFRTVVLQHQERTDYTVTEGDFKMDGNVMVLHIAKNGNEDLLKITEDTPFCVLSEHKASESYYVKLIPGS